MVGRLADGALHCLGTSGLKMSGLPAFVTGDRLESFCTGGWAGECLLAGLPGVIFDARLPDRVEVGIGEVQLEHLVYQFWVLHGGQHVSHGQLLDGHLQHAGLSLESCFASYKFSSTLAPCLFIPHAVNEFLYPRVALVEQACELCQACFQRVGVLEADPDGESLNTDSRYACCCGTVSTLKLLALKYLRYLSLKEEKAR